MPPIDKTAGEGGNRFNPETTKDVELGFKYSGDSIGVPVTFNVAAYQQWVEDTQRAAYVPEPGGTPSLVTTNVPKAKITGVELALDVSPAPWLDMGVSGAYTDARYTDNEVILSDCEDLRRQVSSLPAYRTGSWPRRPARTKTARASSRCGTYLSVCQSHPEPR